MVVKKIIVLVVPLCFIISVNSQSIINLNKGKRLDLHYNQFIQPIQEQPSVAKYKAEITEFKDNKQKLDFGPPKIVHLDYKEALVADYKKTKKSRAKFSKVKFNADQVEKFQTMLFKDISLDNIKYTDLSHGFFSNQITCIAEDKLGKMYFSSEGYGVGEFTGSKIKIYNVNSKLPSNQANYIFSDSKNRIWIATTAGICYFIDGELYIPEKNDLFFGDTESIDEDKFGNIWICTKSKGAVKFDGTFFETYNIETGLTSNKIKKVLVLDNEIWVAYDGKGFSRHSDKKIYRYFDKEGVPTITLSFLADSKKTIWITFFDKNILRFMDGQFYEYPLFENHEERIFDIQENSKGIWMASYKFGLLNLKDDKYTLFNTKSGLVSDPVYRMHIDKNLNVWTVHPSKGISRLDQHIFYCFPDKYFGMSGIMNFIEDKNKNIWLLPDGGEIARMDGSSFFSYKIKLENDVMVKHSWAGKFDDEGNLWLGTLGHGILKIAKQDCEFYYLKEDKNVCDVEKTKDGSIWFGFYNDELIRYRQGKFLVYNKRNELNFRNISKIEEIDDNSIWVGSFNDGIVIIKGDSIARLNHSNGLISDQVNSIFQDNQKRIWISTYNGLNMIDDHNIYTINTASGLLSNSINCFIQDSSQRVWISGDDGISRIDFLNDKKFVVKNFNKTYGLNLTGFINAGIVTSTGDIYFSNHSKVIKYLPENEDTNLQAPRLYIEELVYQDTVISKVDTSKTYFVPAGGNIKVNVNAINWGFENTFQYQYSYIKNGTQSSVFNLKDNRQIIFSDMPHGEYLVKIMVCDINNKKGEMVLKLDFLPFWWQTVFFKSALVFFIFLVILFIFYIRTRNSRRIQKRLEDEVMKKTKELLEENKIKDALLNEIHHRVKNNLQIMSSLIYLQTKYVEDEKGGILLKNIRTKIDSMALIHEMLYTRDNLKHICLKDFLYNFAMNVKNITIYEISDLKFDFELEEIDIKLNMAIVMGMLTAEIITNSIKHAFANCLEPLIRMELKKSDTLLIYRIGDNGTGFEEFATQKQSLGIRLIEIFSRQLNAEKTIDRTNGTNYTFSIPLK